jgi:hypothetical protein
MVPGQVEFCDIADIADCQRGRQGLEGRQAFQGRDAGLVLAGHPVVYDATMVQQDPQTALPEVGDLLFVDKDWAFDAHVVGDTPVVSGFQLRIESKRQPRGSGLDFGVLQEPGLARCSKLPKNASGSGVSAV